MPIGQTNTFDPDAYLAETATPTKGKRNGNGFDPDEYLRDFPEPAAKKVAPVGIPTMQTEAQGIFQPEDTVPEVLGTRLPATPESEILRKKEEQKRQWEAIAEQPRSISRGYEEAPPQFKGEEFLTNPIVNPVGALLKGSVEGVKAGAEQIVSGISEADRLAEKGMGAQAYAAATLGAAGGLLKMGFSAATPFVPVLQAFTIGGELATQVPGEGFQKELAIAQAPFQTLIEPETIAGKSAAEIADLVYFGLVAHGVHKALAARVKGKFAGDQKLSPAETNIVRQAIPEIKKAAAEQKPPEAPARGTQPTIPKPVAAPAPEGKAVEFPPKEEFNPDTYIAEEITKTAEPSPPAAPEVPAKVTQEERPPAEEARPAYFRGGGEGSALKGKTLVDILKYEREDLGNEDVVAEKGVDPTKVKSENLKWVASSEDYAKEFGDVSKVDVGEHRVVAHDGSGGLLIEVTPPTSPEPAHPGASTEAVAKPEDVSPYYVTLAGKKYPIQSLEEASQKFSALRDKTGSGVTRMSEAGLESLPVFDQSGKQVAHVAYNGKVFEGKGDEWTPETKLLYGKKFVPSTPGSEAIPLSARRDVIKKLGGPETMTANGPVGRLSDKDLIAYAKEKGAFETAPKEEAPGSEGRGIANQQVISQKVAEGKLEPHHLNNMPDEVRAPVKAMAQEMLNEAKGIYSEKGGIGREDTYEGKPGGGDVVAKWGTVSTSPDWFRELSRSKEDVIKNLEKIVNDDPKNALAQHLIDQIVEMKTKGRFERGYEVLPADEDFAKQYDSYVTGKWGETAKPELTLTAPESKAVPKKPAPQEEIFTPEQKGQAAYPRPNEGVRSNIPLAEQVKGTMFEQKPAGQEELPIGKPKPIKSAADYKQELIDKAGYKPEEAEVHSKLQDARATTWAKQTGRPKEEWYTSRIGEIRKTPLSEVPAEALMQVKGKDGKPLFRAVAAKLDGQVHEGKPGEIHWNLWDRLLPDEKVTEVAGKLGLRTDQPRYDTFDLLTLLAAKEPSEQLADGFMTVDGKFVNRKEASRMARAASPEWSKGFEGESDALRMKGLLYQNQNAPTFYSGLQRIIEQKMPNRASADQVRAIIRDAKKDEVVWTGLDDYLKEHPTVTKQEITDFLKQNEVRVEEVVAGERDAGQLKRDELRLKAEEARHVKTEIALDLDARSVYVSGQPARWMYRDKLHKKRDVPERYVARLDEADDAINRWDNLSAADEWDSEIGNFPSTRAKFGSYVLPGAKEGSYRELKLTLPEKKVHAELKQESENDWRVDSPGSGTFHIHKSPGGDIYIANREGSVISRGGPGKRFRSVDEAFNWIDETTAVSRDKNQQFRSGHFDEPNILAHVRFNERTDAQGKKTLFIEEIQSDWHEKGRKEGYADTDKKRFVVKSVLGDQPTVASFATHREAIDYVSAHPEELLRAMELLPGSNVPDAPFKTAWPELAMKRMIRWAAENGYDRIAWTTGEQQSARYDLSKQLSALSYVKRGDAYDIKGITKGRNSEWQSIASGIPEAKLEEYVGKDLAKKIIAGEGDETPHRPEKMFHGVDLKVGGEGMKGFYDQIIPSIADKLGKKFGAKTRETRIETEPAPGDVPGETPISDEGMIERNVHSLDITPTMRESALNTGFSLFQGKQGAVEFTSEGKAVIHAISADLSTMAHESGHIWRRDLYRSVENALPEFKPQIEKDIQTLEKWVGAKDGNWTVPQEEKFARGLERYLREGRAPIPELKAVFERFKEWLTEIYKSVKGSEIDVNLSPEVKKVLDRMLGKEAVEAKETLRGEASGPAASQMIPVPVSMAPVNREPIRASAIIGQVSKDLGVPIRSGHARFRTSAGFFKVDPEVIRNKEANDLAVTSHEIAHFIDKRVLGAHSAGTSQRFAPWGKELSDLDYDQTKRRRNEGFAEFMRHYITMDDAQQVAPKFYDHFVNTFLTQNPKVAEAINKMKASVTEWRNQGAEARILSQIDWDGSKAKGKFNLKDVATTIGHWAQKSWDNQLAPLNWYVNEMLKKRGTSIENRQDPYKLAMYTSKTAGAKARQMVLRGVYDFRLQKIGKSFEEILKPVNKEARRAVVYAYAKAAIADHARGVNPGITLADAKYFVENNSKPEFETFAKEVTDWNSHLLDYLIDAGGLTGEAKDAMRLAHPTYIMMKRVFAERPTTGGGSGKGFVDLPTPIKRKHGGGEEIQNPLESMIQQSERLIAIADKARVARAVVDLAESTPGSGAWVEKVSGPMQATSFEAEQLRKQLSEIGIELPMEKMDDILTVFTQGKQYFGKDNIVSVIREGKREYYQLHPDLYSSLKGMDKWVLPPALNLILGAPNRLARLGATGIRAGFLLVTNPLRDPQTFAMQSDYTSGAPWLAYKGMVKAFGHSEIAEQYRASGGEMAQPLGLDRRMVQNLVEEALMDDAKSKALHIVHHPIDALREVMGFPEAGPRLTEFEAAMKKWQPQIDEALSRGDAVRASQLRENAAIEAGMASDDVTVNFKRMGTYTAVLNQIIPFFNPGVQGITKMARTIREHPVRSGIRAFGWLTAPTAALWYINRDEDWYKALPAWQKLGFWNFKVGDKIIRLPKPFEWGYLFAGIPEAALNAAYQNDPEIFTRTLKQMAKNFGPVDFTDPVSMMFSPALLKPAAEAYFNWDTFRDRPVVPRGMEGLLPEDQWTDYTTGTAKVIGKILGVAPVKIDHLLSGYSGGLASDILHGIPTQIKESADLPVIGRIFTRQDALGFGSEPVQRFYEELDKATRYKQTADRYLNLKPGEVPNMERVKRSIELRGGSDSDFALYLAYKPLNDVAGKLKMLRDKQRSIDQVDLDPGVKKLVKDAVNKAAIELVNAAHLTTRTTRKTISSIRPATQTQQSTIGRSQ